MTIPKPEAPNNKDPGERAVPSNQGQIFSDPDHVANEQTAPKEVQADLKEAKQVMDDEGGANQASLKQQQVKHAEKKAEAAKNCH